jgi:purine-binding chemotaxis protein CheW
MKQPKPHSDAAAGNAASAEDSVRKTSFFTVFVNDSIFGLEVKDAQAIYKVGTITPIPLIHKEIAGFINLRGKAVVAVSLRRRLGAACGNGAAENIAIGVERGSEHLALLVDRVGDVLALPSSARTDLPPHCDEAQSRYTRDLYVHDSKLIPILDLDRLFDFESGATH